MKARVTEREYLHSKGALEQRLKAGKSRWRIFAGPPILGTNRWKD
ncbi:hypothetical protein B4135_2949 [Caldibacillus debilis]|uniref:Uncharacterized protein n=1 Tax=Caldibacillus debilis TaxID=301148 RepID=A0A150LMV0_9BACI|nr:hypothetical protein B4135_2949 [Caldibacillus debilis]